MSPRPRATPFFFQAEAGIRDVAVTGVQTCALPICLMMFVSSQADDPRRRGRGLVLATRWEALGVERHEHFLLTARFPARAGELEIHNVHVPKIGRASCRESVEIVAVAGLAQERHEA